MSERAPLEIRQAGPGDAAAIAAIYAPLVAGTAVSFEAEPPDAQQMARRIVAANTRHRWLVAESLGEVAGYAYATSHRNRAAYRYSVETSVYLHPDHYGRGVAAALYRRLFEELSVLGYYQAFAGIALPNPASTALHARVGFRHIGTFPRVGFKLGRWHDVSWWHRTLRSGTPSSGR